MLNWHIRVAQQVEEALALDAESADQLFEFPAGSLAIRTGRTNRGEHNVFCSVLGRYELDDAHSVALGLKDQSADRVGDEIGLTLLEETELQ